MVTLELDNTDSAHSCILSTFVQSQQKKMATKMEQRDRFYFQKNEDDDELDENEDGNFVIN